MPSLRCLYSISFYPTFLLHSLLRSVVQMQTVLMFCFCFFILRLLSFFCSIYAFVFIHCSLQGLGLYRAVVCYIGHRQTRVCLFRCIEGHNFSAYTVLVLVFPWLLKKVRMLNQRSRLLPTMVSKRQSNFVFLSFCSVIRNTTAVYGHR